MEKNSLKIGQYRKQPINYITEEDYLLAEIPAESEYGFENNFKNKAIQLTTTRFFDVYQNYYLNVTFKQYSDSSQLICMYLKNKDTEDKNHIQVIKTVEIKPGSGEMSFDTIFSPILADFDEVVISLQRIPIDYETEGGREILVKVNHIAQIKNLLENMRATSLAKMGIQGPSGLLMCINGEEIRIGRTGIYEMAYDIEISFLGVIASSSDPKEDTFIIDYQY